MVDLKQALQQVLAMHMSELSEVFNEYYRTWEEDEEMLDCIDVWHGLTVPAGDVDVHLFKEEGDLGDIDLIVYGVYPNGKGTYSADWTRWEKVVIRAEEFAQHEN